MTMLDLAPGTITNRTEMKSRFGGGIQGGIQTPANGETVLAYSDPSQGVKYGYTFDGYVDDEHGLVFHYTGEGVYGDQKMTDGNKALLDSVDDGRVVMLFVAASKKGTPGGVKQRFVGQAFVDPVLPYVERWAPDHNGDMRRVFVFRLRPMEGVTWVLKPNDAQPPATVNQVVDLPSSPKPSTPAPKVKKTGAKDKATEKHATATTVARIAAGEREVVRREGTLVTAFEEHLTAAGHQFKSFQITIEGEAGSLIPDLYDITDNVLYEAKGNATRSAVRMAIGQLLDYRRHVPGRETLRVAVLLPSAPTPDVQQLLVEEGIGLVYQDEHGFVGWPLP
ncbi:hypothetical protein [Streptomyces paromomycinus]|uniref:ScoMcrA-like SRA domain-containing protein n=1 Tax=Streptomyces paromomycinus TaxID=92743 RepID=A0A401W8R4_STREY|nr:hypothetical protein [Streptomyces paromomycinus]GCD45704.1 hypothetical protein GKJPGBOP_05442 [Streptomyces paromomycinus]